MDPTLEGAVTERPIRSFPSSDRVPVRSKSGRGLSAGRVLCAGMLLLAPVLAACGGGEGGPPTLTWYTNPDNGGQANLAAKCTEEADGRYRIETQGLPSAADAQREQLVRRLAAKDASIDLMSLDPPFTAEFANAGFLYEFTEDQKTEFTDGILEAPIVAATWKDKLVAAPFWANTQLLWYRKSVAEAAGVDPEAEDFTWEQMIQAAADQQKTIGVQANRYEGYMVWINALIASAGGQILDNPEAGQEAAPAIDSEAGAAAAGIIGALARSAAATPGISTADEEAARAAFQGESGAFLVNWPYVWAAANGEVEAGTLDQSVVDDIAWARYPRVDAAQPSKPPLGGINLAIGGFSEHRDTFAVEAARCITSVESQAYYMVFSGNPAAADAVYDRPEVKEAFPMADLIRDSINEAGPRPITPFYTDVSSSVQRSWHPPNSVSPPQTPQESAELIDNVLDGEVLL